MIEHHTWHLMEFRHRLRMIALMALSPAVPALPCPEHATTVADAATHYATADVSGTTRQL